MAGIVQYPVPTKTAGQFWTGQPKSDESLMIWNQDITNTVYIGNLPQISANGLNTVPIQPNTAISITPTKNWFVIGSAAGILPLVVVPGGLAYFLGITNGYGNLSLPTVQSPNFVSGVSGWQISKNGNAQFNNLTIRGVFNGTNFVINSNGAFFYSGTPAAGNLIASIASSAVSDGLGNAVVSGGYTSYSQGTPCFALSVASTTITSYTAATEAGPYTATGAQINVGTGILELIGTPVEIAGPLGLVPMATPAVSGNTIAYGDTTGNLDFVSAADGQAYSTGRKTITTTATIVVSAVVGAPVTLLTANVVGGKYRFKTLIVYLCNQAAGTPSFEMNGTIAITTIIGKAQFQANGGGAVSNSTIINGTSPAMNGPVMNAGLMAFELEGEVVFAAGAGTFTIQGFTSLAADTFSVAIGSFLEMMPVSS
jgi:hypothetical protein